MIDGPWPKGPLVVLVDAGFTLVTFDGDRMAALIRADGLELSGRAINATERQIRAEKHPTWAFRPGGGPLRTAPEGPAFFGAMIRHAGAREDRIVAAASRLWKHHLAENLFSRLYFGVPTALWCLRAAGIRLAVVSNSEGTITPLFERIGLAPFFELIVDSWTTKIAKPDPRIFRHVLDCLGVRPDQAVMVGDSLKADVEGAQSVGIPAALLDPYGFYPNVKVPRYSSFARFASAVLAAPF